MEQNRKPRDKPHNYVNLIFDKGAKIYCLLCQRLKKRKTPTSISGAGKIETDLCKIMKLEHFLTSCKQINKLKMY